MLLLVYSSIVRFASSDRLLGLAYLAQILERVCSPMSLVLEIQRDGSCSERLSCPWELVHNYVRHSLSLSLWSGFQGSFWTDTSLCFVPIPQIRERLEVSLGLGHYVPELAAWQKCTDYRYTKLTSYNQHTEFLTIRPRPMSSANSAELPSTWSIASCSLRQI